MGIDSNVIVNLYFWYQLLKFLTSFLTPFMVVGVVSSVILIILSHTYAPIYTTLEEDKESRKKIRRVAIYFSIVKEGIGLKNANAHRHCCLPKKIIQMT